MLWLLRSFAKFVLGLRYRVTLRGVEEVARRGRQGILFLPNHPALMDPVLLLTHLNGPFSPRPLADRDQITTPGTRWFARRVGARPLPDMAKHGPEARHEIEAALQECAEGLRRGENLLLYPSGHLYRTRHEDLRGNSAAQELLRLVPSARVVLIRTRGLWGSSFSWITGRSPSLGQAIWRGILKTLASVIFFAPRRDVSIELFEPPDLPRNADRGTFNALLERFYNENAPPARYVPYTPWERGGRRDLPDPVSQGGGETAADVPSQTRDLVYAQLRAMSGVNDLRDELRLAYDLGLDSLARSELMVWLGKEFGFHAADVSALQTVADVLLAARGQSAGGQGVEVKRPPKAWLAPRPARRGQVPAGRTIGDVFLAQARRAPSRIVIADQIGGARSYRDLITAIFVLSPLIRDYPGERVGIMLPASVAAVVAYLAALFAGKTPVMVNWTTGSRNIAHSLDLTGVSRVITVGPLVARIESQGTDLSVIRDKFVMLEQLAAGVSKFNKLAAALRARLSWSSLAHCPMRNEAVVLLTSGSEALPKAVPLTHENILTNVRDVAGVYQLYENDRILGFLPPFHSFGLTVTTVLPLAIGACTVYHANPTESWTLARLIESYGVTLIVGTPTFLGGILRSAAPGALETLRLAVTGAERCPPRVYDAFAAQCPKCVVLEGYGVTECSPIVAANREDDPRHGTIGRLMPSVEGVIIDEERQARSAPGEPGMLLVRGASVFGGYLGSEAKSPFVEFDQKQWYRTGDLVVTDADGVLTFRGRLKRFVKLGGEMISLPAIEGVLERHYASDADDGPVVAVEATPSEEHPEIVLFTTRQIERPEANRLIRDAQLSPLHNVSRVVRVESIPVLGTGKTDYKALRQSLAADQLR
ncbi:MAG: AMP-binding protein [Phycisphaerales bacterium]|nr:AMP-binding protein [Phycisphaerales bacterium]